MCGRDVAMQRYAERLALDASSHRLVARRGLRLFCMAYPRRRATRMPSSHLVGRSIHKLTIVTDLQAGPPSSGIMTALRSSDVNPKMTKTRAPTREHRRKALAGLVSEDRWK